MKMHLISTVHVQHSGGTTIPTTPNQFRKKNGLNEMQKKYAKLHTLSSPDCRVVSTNRLD